MKMQLHKFAEFYRCLYSRGHELASHHTDVGKIFSDFVEQILYLHSLGPIKHGKFTDMRPSFRQCQWIFTNSSMISIFPCVYQ